MDGCHRKRKADTDQDWSGPTEPHPLASELVLRCTPIPNKRPRRYMRRLSAGPARPPPIPRFGNDVEDIGIVSTAHPGPASGSLLRSSSSVRFLELHYTTDVPSYIDLNSFHIPPLHPLVNRHTLKELHTDAILRNPELRHDILFEPTLQFRPTASRRKREASERYWAAVSREVETGCTCVSFDFQGRPSPLVCACNHVPVLPAHPILVYLPFRVVTLRMPSRLGSLISEFLEVLLLVIQPLSSVSGNPYVASDSQAQQQTNQAAYIRSIFDPSLIEQELRHNVFDPSGLFKAIGNVLKGHCAPLRDPAIDAMVQVAESCAPGGSGTKADAVRAVRMCMDILEFMKLDLANLQLQTMRPILTKTSGQFEYKVFRKQECSLQNTRQWLRSAHLKLESTQTPIPHPLYPRGLRYTSLCRNQQVYLATLAAVTDSVFYPPDEYPDTAYLDHNRLILLSSNAADITAMHLFLLLYRQLSLSQPFNRGNGSRTMPSIDEPSLEKIKNEIRDVGTARMGLCFLEDYDNEGRPKLQRRWDNVRHDVVLQIARRVQESRGDSCPLQPLLNLACTWADTNFNPSSPLASLLRDRLRDVVFNAVVGLAFPGRASSSSRLASIDFCGRAEPKFDIPMAIGMEPLAGEIRTLAEKIARLSLVHLNAYLPLYEHEQFLESS